ncbi:MAG: NAD-dependent epimerase/dehydratase family protein [Prolixibacteraceae bacterium]|nr:NAD-dependent epimerase/dehydratase family protein [Prolixibacteraceae bacterium]
MKCFVTGGTGFIGNRLVEALVDKGYEVNVLVRKAKDFENKFRHVTVFEGDLFNSDILDKAIESCDCIFHLAAYANLWSKDKTLAYRTNFTATQNILELALKHKIKKVVFTSSAATLPPAAGTELIDESFPVPELYLTEYESTKQQAEQLCIDYCKKNLHVVIVNPSRVYGPGFLNKSNSVTILIKKYLEGKWRIIPGDGSQIGNYVFIDDVVSGHIKALEKGRSGERYILGGTNISYNVFFDLLAKVSGKKYKMFHLPMWIMMIVANFEFFMAESFGKKPLITPPWIKRYQQNRPLSTEKAKREIQYSETPLEKGIKKTIDWLKTS